MQSQQLPTESQVLEDEVLTGTESADQPTDEMSKRHDHGKNCSGKIRIELCAKSFILQVYDVLARHTPGTGYGVGKDPPGGQRKRVWVREFFANFELLVGVGIGEFLACKKCDCPVTAAFTRNRLANGLRSLACGKGQASGQIHT